jgi:hypothetical protein
MRVRKLTISIALAALLALVSLTFASTNSRPLEAGEAVGCPDGPISPASVEATLLPGQSIEIEKCVEIPAFPPVLDVYFLADTTGSMGGVLAAVQADAATILGTIDGGSADAQFGAGDYKDFPFDAYAFSSGAAIGTDDGVGGAADASDAIAAWSASGGADGPEGQLFALNQIATDPAIGFRATASKVVVWFGDAPGHDPVCSAISGEAADITEATVTADLVAAGIKVVAISTLTGYPAGLDDDPTLGGGNYVGACGFEGGLAGQATRIAAATGGVHLSGVGTGDIVDAILAGIGSVTVEVEMASTCTDPITTTFEPASQDVAGGGIAIFTETISVAEDAPGGFHECRDYVLIDGAVLTDTTGAPITEFKRILVADGKVTGIGQITEGPNGKSQLKASFGGNVAYNADGSLSGHWNAQLHNVAGTANDGGHFSSTEITSLQLENDGGAGPAPPDANGNVAFFTALGKYNGVADHVLFFCVIDRGEPGSSDLVRIAIFAPGGGLVYDSASDFPPGEAGTPLCPNPTLVDKGNVQIHNGVRG